MYICVFIKLPLVTCHLSLCCKLKPCFCLLTNYFIVCGNEYWLILNCQLANTFLGFANVDQYCEPSKQFHSLWELFITTLHGMQTQSYDEISVRLSVCLSVRLSVKRVHCDKTEERNVQIFISYERTFILVFWEEEWLVGGDPFYLKFWVNRPALERNRLFWTDNRS